MINVQISMLEEYILVFARIGGMLFLNPIISRKNVPIMFKVGMVLGLTLLFTPLIDFPAVSRTADLGFILSIVGELLIGIAFTFVFTFFYYMIFFAGDVMDFHFGMSMSKVFDPSSNIQASVSGSIFNYMFILYFFALNCHLLLIEIILDSFSMVPIGTFAFSEATIVYILDMFVSVFSLIVKLIVPFVALEFTVEIAMGILMKLIPQIHIFVINIQIKMLLAFLLLLSFSSQISDFMDRYILSAFQAAQKALEVMVT